ncbi:MAG: hypothetical protein DCF28_10620 [Alphaproteobacteria bacterium]|nr:MAG: hypothetical protein DCF28_10620 [Alphaproteobacteria bacterium]
MIAVVRLFPVRSALLATTVVAFIIDMWTGARIAGALIWPIIIQGVGLAQVYSGRRPQGDRARTTVHEGLRG